MRRTQVFILSRKGHLREDYIIIRHSTHLRGGHSCLQVGGLVLGSVGYMLSTTHMLAYMPPWQRSRRRVGEWGGASAAFKYELVRLG